MHEFSTKRVAILLGDSLLLVFPRSRHCRRPFGGLTLPGEFFHQLVAAFPFRLRISAIPCHRMNKLA